MIALLRNRVRTDFDDQVFWPWASRGNLAASDRLLDTRGRWRAASTFPELRGCLPPRPPPGPTLGDALLAITAVAAVGVVTYKVAQLLLDEDFGGRSFPASFRSEKIAEHLAIHGAACLRCDRRVRVPEAE